MKAIFYNGKVYTGSSCTGDDGKKVPVFADSFAVEEGRFTAVGTIADMSAYLSTQTNACGGDFRMIDLGGRFVCAGFNDSHMHLLGFGASLAMANLAENTGSLAGLMEYLKAYAAEHGVQGDADPLKNASCWIRGRGWNQDYFADEKRMPDRWDLDRISADRPIVITRACGHCAAVNSKALELAGITADTEAPEGGDIGRAGSSAACHGCGEMEPNGLLFDQAIGLVNSIVPLPSKNDIKEMIKLACARLNSFGITSSQTDDYGVFRALGWQAVNDAYRELEASGELTVRVFEQSNFTDYDEFKGFVEAGNVTGKGTEMFRTGPLKMLGDGSLGSRTAHLSRPYADDPDTCGFNLFSDEHMNKMVSFANENGMSVAIHAIGDACLEQVLNAVEKALEEHPRADHRHGVVHCQISTQEQLDRIARLGMHVYAQSIFLDYDNHIVEARAGRELAATSYSWKTLMDKGVCVSNGSDCPVELPDVMRGIQCAVTRTSIDGTGPYLPDQAFTVQEALDSFTSASAHASFDEDAKGRIAPGFIADFTVLGTDPFTADPNEIHNIPVLETYLGGIKVYGK